MMSIRPAEDQPRALQALHASEALVLWAMRLLTQGLRNNVPVFPELYRIYRDRGAIAAVEPLDLLMGALHCAAARLLAINCEHCPFVTADEERLLSAIACHQAGADTAAEVLMAPVLTAGTEVCVDMLLRQAAWALMASGIALPARPALDRARRADDRQPQPAPQRPTMH